MAILDRFYCSWLAAHMADLTLDKKIFTILGSKFLLIKNLALCMSSKYPSLVSWLNYTLVQGSYRQVWVKFKGFTRTSKDYHTVFKD